jgi:hypothetical protein
MLFRGLPLDRLKHVPLFTNCLEEVFSETHIHKPARAILLQGSYSIIEADCKWFRKGADLCQLR